jgi:predicted nucleic acid-binding Zn ribbon protein
MGADPQHISQALSELFTLRGYARVQADAQLQQVWDALAGPQIAGGTKVGEISRGVLQIAVTNAALLAELTAFHKPALLKGLREKHPELRIRDLKFRLRSDMKRRTK